MSDYQVMPPLSAEEYAALKADIAEKGVLVPVVRDQHGNLIDGHHRSQIADELGVTYRVDVVQVQNEEQARSLARMYNLARRHLTRAQKRELIADEITADPNRSDRAIARVCGCDHKTVASVRRELSGEIPHRPTEAEARERSERIRDSIQQWDVDILVALLRDVPPVRIVNHLHQILRSAEQENSDEPIAVKVMHTHFQAVIDAVMQWPHGGWFVTEIERHDDELHALLVKHRQRMARGDTA